MIGSWPAPTRLDCHKKKLNCRPIDKKRDFWDIIAKIIVEIPGMDSRNGWRYKTITSVELKSGLRMYVEFNYIN